MGILEILSIGVGLSMDAFAVAICKGLGMKKLKYGQAVVIALFFGGFQALMPAIGWFLGRQFEQYIKSFDHWVAFILLGIIGFNMIREAVKSGNECGGDGCLVDQGKLNLKELFMLAIATSIDALAVGITFAFLNVSIVPAISIIGVTTFVLSFFGVVIGKLFGARYKSKAEFAGGIILIFIGLKILLEHLGIFG